MLANAGVDFALTLYGLDKADQFWPNVKKAMENGLTERQALAALTTILPKSQESKIKQVSCNKATWPTLFMAKGDLFKDGVIQSVWTQGQEIDLIPREQVDFAGEYTTTGE